MNAPNPLVVPNDKQKMGKPCKRGHSGLRYKSDHRCVECNRERARKENMTPEQIEAKRKRNQRMTPEQIEANRKRNRKWRTENPERKRAANARVIRMRAGGIQFYLGCAPTVEDAQRLRRKIKEESPK